MNPVQSHKFPLEIRHLRLPWLPQNCQPIPLKSCLPFYQGMRGGYWHRVRSGLVHRHNGKFSHTRLRMWCGYSGSLGSDRRGRGQACLSGEVDGPICAICEGKAIGAGLLGASEINGRAVIFAPRGSA